MNLSKNFLSHFSCVIDPREETHNKRHQLTDSSDLLSLSIFMECPHQSVQSLLSHRATKASTTICKLVLIFLSQFFHSFRYFSSQAKSAQQLNVLESQQMM